MPLEQTSSASAETRPATETRPAVGDRHVVTTPEVACDGGDAGLGHPRVYLSFGTGAEIVCPYCSRRYVRAEGARAGHGH
jgi:uncharacterized Zn-finger protein